MSESKNRAAFDKGYTENCFAQKVYHLRIRLRGDTDEVGLRKRFEHDRDGYTAAKTEFVKKYTELAKLYG